MKLFLNGGGGSNELALPMQRLSEIVDCSKPLLYIPLAMDNDFNLYDGCYQWINEQIMNTSISNVDMVRSFEELAIKNLDSYCAIFIGGGNTYKLLSGLKKSGSFEKIKEYIDNDGVIIGGSAGSVIFGKDINVIASMDSNDVNLVDTLGFDVLSGISIFPHYINKKRGLTEEENRERIEKYTREITKFSLSDGDVLALPEEDTLYLNGDNIEMIGNMPYYEFKNGIRTTLNIDNVDIKHKIKD